MEVNKRGSEICEGVYWIGSREICGNLNSNPYLIVEDNEAVLVNSGSILNFQWVYENIESLISLEHLKWVIVQQPDPSFCSNISLFEKMGLRFKVIAHAKTLPMLEYYCIKSEIISTKIRDSIQFQSGRKLSFIEAPFINQPGTILVHDEATGTLFTGILFSAHSERFQLMADDDYWHRVQVFHRENLVSSDVLMQVAGTVKKLNLSLIAPFYGSIIEDDIERYLELLENSTFSVFSEQEHISVSPTSTCFGEWERLKTINKLLVEELKTLNEQLLRCPVTGLYNEKYFMDYLRNKLSGSADIIDHLDSALVVISVDNLSKIKFSYGDTEVDEVLRRMAYLLEESKFEDSLLFRLGGAFFACIINNTTLTEASLHAENMRNKVAKFKGFIEPVTVSMGVVSLREVLDLHGREKRPGVTWYDVGLTRVALAKRMGMNMVCNESAIKKKYEKNGKILIVDTDHANVDYLIHYLEDNGYQALTAYDGEAAYEIAKKEKPDIILSEIMLPKMDGFSLRENLLDHSDLKSIPFIVLSFVKNEDAVKRSISLEIEYYFKKPYMALELMGSIQKHMRTGVRL